MLMLTLVGALALGEQPTIPQLLGRVLIPRSAWTTSALDSARRG
ncbi:hypothetical protein [Nocardia sp. NPDC005745]